MKKLVVLMTVITTLLVGCTGKTETNVDVKELASEIATDIEFKDELSEVDKDLVETIYPNVDMSLIEDSCVYYNGGSTVEQIAIFKAKDEKSAREFQDGLEKCIQSQIDTNRNYLPDEIPKLEDPVLKVQNQYVFFVVSEHNDEVSKLLP